MRLEAIDTLSAALFSAWMRVLAAASISGTTAMVMPATRITTANFSEKDAPRQMPLNHRTPLINVPQPDRRTRTRDTTAIVATTKTVERAMRYPVPRPLPPAITGPTTGMVSGGGASTGGRVAGVRRPLAAVRRRRRDDPFSRGAVTEASRGAGGGAVDAGAAGAAGCGGGTAVSVGVRPPRPIAAMIDITGVA